MVDLTVEESWIFEKTTLITTIVFPNVFTFCHVHKSEFKKTKSFIAKNQKQKSPPENDTTGPTGTWGTQVH